MYFQEGESERGMDRNIPRNFFWTLEFRYFSQRVGPGGVAELICERMVKWPFFGNDEVGPLLKQRRERHRGCIERDVPKDPHHKNILSRALEQMGQVGISNPSWRGLSFHETSNPCSQCSSWQLQGGATEGQTTHNCTCWWHCCDLAAPSKM